MGKIKRRGALILSLMTAILYHNTDVVFADEAAEFEKYLSEQGFPDSYKTMLVRLHEIHPNWNFEAMLTGLDWNDVISNEMIQTRNLIPTYPQYATSFFDTELPGSFNWESNAWTVFSAPYWVQASRQCIEHYMDPRNWLNERNIFMFEKLSFSEETQTIEGVERILKGTFMENTYIDAEGVAAAEYFESDILSCDDRYISGAQPGDSVSQLFDAVSIKGDNVICIVTGADGREKQPTDLLGTGDRIVFYSQDANGNKIDQSEYTLIIFGDINGDGRIDAIDRAYIKGYVYGITKLNDIQMMASDINQDQKIDAIDRAYVKGYVYQITKITQALKNVRMTYAQAFYNIGRDLNISPYHLAARVRQEQGVGGTSPNISGIVSGYEGYYNYYNIKASGVTIEEIVTNGMIEAVKEGWNTRYKALKGGSAILASNHISKGQDTMYLQKFDVEGEWYGYFWHQYMQNVVAPYSESTTTYKTYENMNTLSNSYTFKIPVYVNMPENVCLAPTKTGNPNTRLSSLIIDGYSLDFNFNTFEYTINVPKSARWVTIRATAYAPTTSITGPGTWAITEDTDMLYISTTAENGDSITYTVKMNRV